MINEVDATEWLINNITNIKAVIKARYKPDTSFSRYILDKEYNRGALAIIRELAAIDLNATPEELVLHFATDCVKLLDTDL